MIHRWGLAGYWAWLALLVVVVGVGITAPSWLLVLPIIVPLGIIGALTAAVWVTKKLGI